MLILNSLGDAASLHRHALLFLERGFELRLNGNSNPIFESSKLGIAIEFDSVDEESNLLGVIRHYKGLERSIEAYKERAASEADPSKDAGVTSLKHAYGTLGYSMASFVKNHIENSNELSFIYDDSFDVKPLKECGSIAINFDYQMKVTCDDAVVGVMKFELKGGHYSVSYLSQKPGSPSMPILSLEYNPKFPHDFLKRKTTFGGTLTKEIVTHKMF